LSGKNAEVVSGYYKDYFRLIMAYGTNFMMYLKLKGSNVNVNVHPISKRIAEYKEMIEQYRKIGDQIVILASRIDENVLSHVPSQEGKKSGNRATVLPKGNLPSGLSMAKVAEYMDRLCAVKEPVEKSAGRKRSGILRDGPKAKKNKQIDDVSNDEYDDVSDENSSHPPDDGSKRSITYEMAKNKGLTPRRKKELRNPRVKNRMKYRKAKIRRKGQVREVRKEMKKYSGEMSGINAFVTKSIKLK